MISLCSAETCGGGGQCRSKFGKKRWCYGKAETLAGKVSKQVTNGGGGWCQCRGSGSVWEDWAGRPLLKRKSSGMKATKTESWIFIHDYLPVCRWTEFSSMFTKQAHREWSLVREACMCLNAQSIWWTAIVLFLLSVSFHQLISANANTRSLQNSTIQLPNLALTARANLTTKQSTHY